MGRVFFCFNFINSNELNGICLCILVNRYYSGVSFFNRECFSGKHGYTAAIICIGTSVPRRHYPVVEDVSFRSGRSSACRCIGVFKIQRVVCRSVAAGDACASYIITVGSIDNIDAFSAIKHLAPVRVKIEFSGYPITFGISASISV